MENLSGLRESAAGSVVGMMAASKDAWAFRLGQCISHKDQSMPSLVLSRFRAGGKRNMEIYGVRSFATVDPQRDRMILGECLVDVVPGSAPCMDCLLWNTGMCPGALKKEPALMAAE